METKNDRYNTFWDKQFKYSYPISFDKENKDYLQHRDKVKCEWYYGDTINLHINLMENCGEEFDVETSYVLVGKELEVAFYNFKYDKLFSTVVNKKDVDYKTMSIDLIIDVDTSKKIFKRGIYHLGVKLKDIEDENNKSPEVMTLIAPDDYELYIK